MNPALLAVGVVVLLYGIRRHVRRSQADRPRGKRARTFSVLLIVSALLGIQIVIGVPGWSTRCRRG